jgi:hypothetical protein
LGAALCEEDWVSAVPEGLGREGRDTRKQGEKLRAKVVELFVAVLQAPASP